jgi:regulator of protease activity HflC (stomatin/prohibitin superfamily)
MGEMYGFVIFLLVVLVLLVLIASNIKIVPQATVYVVERLGGYHASWSTGVHMTVPFIDRVARKVTLKEQIVDFKPQPVITKDNVTMQIDTVVFFQITDAKLYTYGVDKPISAIENLSATTLRNIIGEIELDSTLTSRDTINSKITSILDTATDKWGIKVTRVELKNILPPREIQDAMEKQMKAERERRESILKAEGDKHSRILVAEGEKQSAILKAEGEKEAAILRAEAVKEQKIREAQGEAEAVLLVQKAVADSVELLNKVDPSNQVIALRSLDTLAKVADGKSTKIIIPSEIQSLASLAVSLKEAAGNLDGNTTVRR